MTLEALSETSGTCFRSYREEDREDVLELCKNVYGGSDDLPRILSGLCLDPLCSPRVILHGSKLVAFCNVRVLNSDDEAQDVFYIEAIRVSESVRGQGVGTRCLQETMRASVSCSDSRTRAIRFLSTTIPENEAMRHIFRQAGWVCRGCVQIWPSYETFKQVKASGDDLRGQYLDLLGVSSLIPPSARDTVPLWEQVMSPDSDEVLRIYNELREAGSCFLLPRYYSLNTIAGASRFLHSEYCKQEGRSIWKLERNGKPPVLLFSSVRTVRPSDQQPDQMISACVVDVSGAECCVAFAASRLNIGCFRITFDSALSAEAMKTSALLSRVETSAFMIFEARM